MSWLSVNTLILSFVDRYYKIDALLTSNDKDRMLKPGEHNDAESVAEETERRHQDHCH